MKRESDDISGPRGHIEKLELGIPLTPEQHALALNEALGNGDYSDWHFVEYGYRPRLGKSPK
ncbi:MAG: hypothetical protein M3R59_06575 [Verrucomicrobiota bacterium]|nr:hypothetical protein [Verrucomicrobiota bacterium]